MRALFQENLQVLENYIIKDDGFHHLAHVIRIKEGELLLLLNGRGLVVKTEVESISKREIKLKYVSSDTLSKKLHIDIALGMPKKEALELCFKEAVELGISNIHLIKSDYAQNKAPEHSRIKSLLISALEQSNSPFLPLTAEMEWTDINYNNYDFIYFLNSQSPGSNLIKFPSSMDQKILLVIGPEGGFSSKEIQYLSNVSNINVLNLPTGILRTPTALAVAAGVVLSRLID